MSKILKLAIVLIALLSLSACYSVNGKMEITPNPNGDLLNGTLKIAVLPSVAPQLKQSLKSITLPLGTSSKEFKNKTSQGVTITFKNVSIDEFAEGKNPNLPLVITKVDDTANKKVNYTVKVDMTKFILNKNQFKALGVKEKKIPAPKVFFDLTMPGEITSPTEGVVISNKNNIQVKEDYFVKNKVLIIESTVDKTGTVVNKEDKVSPLPEAAPDTNAYKYPLSEAGRSKLPLLVFALMIFGGFSITILARVIEFTPKTERAKKPKGKPAKRRK